MLQRIQTVFLILVALSSVALFFTSQDVELFGSTSIASWLSIVSFLVALVSITGFKKRPRQMVLNNINIFINALLIGLLTYWLLLVSGGIQFPEKGIELVFPVVSIVCLFLANIYIRKDEKLVKSVDRLR